MNRYPLPSRFSGALVAGSMLALSACGGVEQEERSEQVQALARDLAAAAVEHFEAVPDSPDWKILDGNDEDVLVFTRTSPDGSSTGIEMSIASSDTDDYDPSTVTSFEMKQSPAKESVTADYYLSVHLAEDTDENQGTWSTTVGYDLMGDRDRYEYFDVYGSNTTVTDEQFTAIAAQAREEVQDTLRGDAAKVMPPESLR